MKVLRRAHCWDMQVNVRMPERMEVGEMRRLVAGTTSMGFEPRGKQEVYGWVEAVLRLQKYFELARRDRGTVRAYIGRVTGLSAAQISRLIARYNQEGVLRPRPQRRRPRFARRYSDEDLRLLAEADELHEGLSGPAMRKILEREYRVYGRTEYQRLAGISVAHLYNLRNRPRYRQMSTLRQKTRPVHNSIGERRCPGPSERPGYLRVDTVHQGDARDGSKGVYHLNSVDAVTQWEVLGAAPEINAVHLLPVLREMIEQYPFRIRGFHADNGSEFINYKVADLLNRLLVEEFTKSRPNRSSDNALVEGKNGAVVRKHLGYQYLPQTAAAAIHQFYREQMNPYLNYHRPCGFATVRTEPNGRKRRIYRPNDYATPWERFRQIPEAESFLRHGTTWADLEHQAARHSDIEAARALQAAKAKLFAQIASLPESGGNGEIPELQDSPISTARRRGSLSTKTK